MKWARCSEMREWIENHNPEFTSMECYMAYGNMESVMDVTEQIVSKAALMATGSMVIEYQGKKFDLTPPWKKLGMADAVKEITGVDFEKIESDEQAREAAVGHGMDANEVKDMTRGKILGFGKSFLQQLRFGQFEIEPYAGSAPDLSGG